MQTLTIDTNRSELFFYSVARHGYVEFQYSYKLEIAGPTIKGRKRLPACPQAVAAFRDRLWETVNPMFKSSQLVKPRFRDLPAPQLPTVI